MEIVRGGHRIEIPRPDKVLFSRERLTKRDLVEYYARVAPRMLPFLAHRPVSMERFPDGVGKPGFYEKRAPRHFPAWIPRVQVRLRAGGRQQQVMVNNAATLIYLAGQACITPHVWLSRADRLDHPDRMIFDLDPSGVPFQHVVEVARRLRAMLRSRRLPAFVLATGGKGLHVWVPLARRQPFDRVREVARALADELASEDPDLATTETRRAKRRGLVFIDYLRNAYGQTAVPPYAVRALPRAPVAVPLSWSELGRRDYSADPFTIRTVGRRLGRAGNPWAR